jgi:hypothetical protein
MTAEQILSPISRRHFIAAIPAGVGGLILMAGAVFAQPVTFEGATFVNKGLVGVARIAANKLDQYGETLGGSGSGIALDLKSWHRDDWTGDYRGTLHMLPDRGWNTQGTTDFRGRLHRFDFTFRPFYGTSTANQNQLSLHYRSSLLFDGGKTTGLDPSGILAATRKFPVLPAEQDRISLDDEAVTLAHDGSLWVSDEYGPYVYHYKDNGKLLGVIRPPEAFIPKRKDSSGTLVDNFSSNNPPRGTTYDPSPGDPLSGRQNNQGFEGLSLSPDGKTLFVLLQSALRQDLDPNNVKTTRHNTRLLAYDLRHNEPKLIGEYVVQLPLFQDPATTSPRLLTAAQSELFALNDHQFLVLARDSNVGFTAANPKSSYRRIDLIDISKATNILGKYDGVSGSIAPLGILQSGITPATYQKFIDINDNDQLNRFGLRNGDPNDKNNLYEKWEGIAIAPVGDRQAPRDYFVFVASDNDFITTQGMMAGIAYDDGADVDTMILVYRVTLPTYAPPHWHGDFGHRFH